MYPSKKIEEHESNSETSERCDICFAIKPLAVMNQSQTTTGFFCNSCFESSFKAEYESRKTNDIASLKNFLKNYTRK